VDDSLGRDDEEGLLPSRPDPPSDYPEELIEEAEARARISTLQRDELLTQSKIFKKETSPPAKEADQRSEAQSYETKHGQDL
jgi:hypothetical protein